MRICNVFCRKGDDKLAVSLISPYIKHMIFLNPVTFQIYTSSSHSPDSYLWIPIKYRVISEIIWKFTASHLKRKSCRVIKCRFMRGSTCAISLLYIICGKYGWINFYRYSLRLECFLNSFIILQKANKLKNPIIDLWTRI